MAFDEKSLSVNSSRAGVVLVTIAGTPADISPSTQSCRSCLVAKASGTTVYMNINGAATSSTWILSTSPISVPVQNLDQLHFLGAAGAETIQIMWRD